MSSPIMRYFQFKHLPLHLQYTSAAFSKLAWQIQRELPDGGEKDEALRHLLIAKDAAVRSTIAHNAVIEEQTL